MKQDFDNNSIESCSNGILFDHTYYGSTILEDFNLSCHETWKVRYA